MDSLVSIYKNMEDASGVNIFVSQINPSPSGTYSYDQCFNILVTRYKFILSIVTGRNHLT